MNEIAISTGQNTQWKLPKQVVYPGYSMLPITYRTVHFLTRT